MEYNIEIVKILDKYIPADGVGTEREKLRMNVMTELLLLVNKNEYERPKESDYMDDDGFATTENGIDDYADALDSYIDYLEHKI